jgi:hypothetical protein
MGLVMLFSSAAANTFWGIQDDGAALLKKERNLCGPSYRQVTPSGVTASKKGSQDDGSGGSFQKRGGDTVWIIQD